MVIVAIPGGELSKLAKDLFADGGGVLLTTIIGSDSRGHLRAEVALTIHFGGLPTFSSKWITSGFATLLELSGQHFSNENVSGFSCRYSQLRYRLTAWLRRSPEKFSSGRSQGR